MRIRHLCLAALMAAGVLGSLRAASATIVENWDSLPATPAPTVAGAFYSLGDGWTARESDVSVTNNNYYGVTTGAQGQNPYSAPQFLGEVDGTNRDNSDASMLVLSPKFQIDNSGNPIVMYTQGGDNGLMAPTSISNIGTSLTASGSGWEGVVVVDSSGNVVESAQRISDGTDYQGLQLATTGLTPGATYQVALIDTYSGGWGWIAMDDVTIPGTAVPEPASMGLLGLGALGLLARRRRLA